MQNLKGKKMSKKIQEDESLDLSFLIGRKITKVISRETIQLDDGKIYNVETNEGCSGCSSGWSYFSGFDTLPTDNVITSVTKSEEHDDEYTIYVFFHDESFDIDCDDGWGNGYYGGGFTVTVREAK